MQADDPRARPEHASRLRPSEALRLHRPEIADAIARHHGSDAHVVGSVARGDDDLDSDLDLMVTFAPGTDLFDLMDLIDELERITGVRVDILSSRGRGAVLEAARRDAVPL
ncbi:nucleotidyltransferase domain-containing protein [Cellulomonas biazotea]|uniref:Nucleotidyltransferase n=1 Tax=Cellulomonas biazotea TaxID=1709 RepID=A0A402DLH3_9CELL|nr:nucleotidyltransferase domain-containing protein [Cellulomonas biazotea]GCE74984.1 nucleotidyltransferase [Cellulomonas biazotea]